MSPFVVALVPIMPEFAIPSVPVTTPPFSTMIVFIVLPEALAIGIVTAPVVELVFIVPASSISPIVP